MKKYTLTVGAAIILFAVALLSRGGARAEDSVSTTVALDPHCHASAMTLEKDPTTPPMSGAKIDPHDEWLANPIAQGEIDAFWNAIKGAGYRVGGPTVDEVGAYVDNAAGRFVVVIDSTSERRRIESIVESRLHTVGHRLQVRCRTSKELGAVRAAVERALRNDSTEHRMPSASGGNEVDASWKIRLNPADVQPFIARHRELADLPITIDPTGAPGFAVGWE